MSRRQPARRNNGLLSFALVVGLIALAVAGWRMLLLAPTVWQLQAIHVSASTQPVMLGHRELGQHPASARSAEANHIRLTPRPGRWWLANNASGKRIDAPSASQGTRYLKRWRLAPGDRIEIGGEAQHPLQTLRVQAVDDSSLTLVSANGQRAQWRDGELRSGKPAFEGCPKQGAAWWKHHFSALGSSRELRLFSIGGQLSCARRWPLAGLPVDSLRVLWSRGSFQIAPGSAAVPIRMSSIGSPQLRGFEQLQLPIGDGDNDVQDIYAGRGGYHIAAEGNGLLLTPLGGSDLWQDKQQRPQPRDPHVSVDYRYTRWAGAGASPRHWLLHHPWWPAIALLAATLGLLSHARARRRRSGTSTGALVPLSLAGLVLAVGLWLQPAIDLRWLYWFAWLGWCWNSLIVMEAQRLRGSGGALWLLALLLSGAGALVMGQLAAGGDSGRWLKFAGGHWGLWGVVGWGLGLVAATASRNARALLIGLFSSRDGSWIALRILVPLLLALVLLLQLAFGREQGLAGVQPVEAAKLLLVLLLAFAGMRLGLLRQVRGNAYRSNRIGVIGHIVAFAVLFWLFADTLLWAVHDMSPVLILGLLVFTLLWKVAPAPAGQQSVAGVLLRSLLVLLAGSIIGLAAMAWLHPEQLPDWLPQYDRFQVWANPAAHPHSGMQVLAAMEYAGSGGLWGGLPHWWGDNGRIMALPAVQDDFITAFALYRFGAIPGLTLLALQLLFLGLLFALGRRVERYWVGTEGLTGRGIALTLFGLAWLFAAHWLIAWANVLGLLPVMGQPMTWLAAGNSHLLLFAYPALAFALLVAWARD